MYRFRPKCDHFRAHSFLKRFSDKYVPCFRRLLGINPGDMMKNNEILAVKSLNRKKSVIGFCIHSPFSVFYDQSQWIKSDRSMISFLQLLIDVFQSMSLRFVYQWKLSLRIIPFNTLQVCGEFAMDLLQEDSKCSKYVEDKLISVGTLAVTQISR